MRNVCLERRTARRNRFCRLTGGILTAILLTGNAFAQRDSTDSVIPVLGDASARWVIKSSPLLLDPENSIPLAVERTLGGRSSVQAEVAYGWPGLQYTRNDTYSRPEVWRGRAEWRIYSRASIRPRGTYFAVESFYKQVNVTESGTIGRGCQNYTCQYFQQYRSLAQKFVLGGHFKWGTQFNIDKNWLFDFYVGVGLRTQLFKRFRPDTSSEAILYNRYYGSLNWFNLNNTDDSQKTWPSMTLGFKIGYVIR